MTSDKKTILVDKFRNKITQDDLVTLGNKLDDANDEAFEPLMQLKTKSYAISVLLLFIGGVFSINLYLGDYKRSIIIFCGAVSWIILRIISYIHIFFGIIFIIATLAYLVWVIVELVSCFKRIKIINGDKVFATLRPYINMYNQISNNIT